MKLKGKLIALLAAFLVSGTAGVLATSSVPAQASSLNPSALVIGSSCSQNPEVQAALQNALKAAAAKAASGCPASAVQAAGSQTCPQNIGGNGKICTVSGNCNNWTSLFQNLKNGNCSSASSGSKAPAASSQTPASSSKAPASSKQPAPVSSRPASSASAASAYSDFQNQVVQLVDQQRAANGLGTLSVDSALTKTATLKSQDMAKLGYFDHTSPTYGSPFDMMKQFGITYRTAGENIAMGQTTPQQVMNDWMNSPGHRANILNSSFTKIGVGIARNSAGRYYWTQQFIG